MRLTETEDYNDKARKQQEDNFINVLCDTSLGATVWHNDSDIEEQMHNCIIDSRPVDEDKFQVILTVNYCRDC